MSTFWIYYFVAPDRICRLLASFGQRSQASKHKNDFEEKEHTEREREKLVSRRSVVSSCLSWDKLLNLQSLRFLTCQQADEADNLLIGKIE